MVVLQDLNNVGTVHRSNKLEYHINPMDEQANSLYAA